MMGNDGRSTRASSLADSIFSGKKKKKRQMGSEELPFLTALTNRAHSVHLTAEARVFSFVHHHFVHLS